MGSFDDFERLLAALQDERDWPYSLAVLSEFSFISLHVGTGPVGVLLAFESPAPDDSSPLNAVKFSLRFGGISDVVIQGCGALRAYEMKHRPGGGYIAGFRGADSEITFGFADIDAVGYRRFKMAKGL